MKPGQPKLRTQPPKSSSGQDALARLDKLSNWSEEPAREIAASLAAGAAPKPAETPATQPKRKRAPDAPWQELMEPPAPGVKSVNYKLPLVLYQKLKYLGGTTLNKDMTKIVIEALEEKTAKLLKERGL